MNCFTKDELILMLKNIDELRFSKFYHFQNLKLRKKVLSMIDMNCDHSKDILCQNTNTQE